MSNKTVFPVVAGALRVRFPHGIHPTEPYRWFFFTPEGHFVDDPDPIRAETWGISWDEPTDKDLKLVVLW